VADECKKQSGIDLRKDPMAMQRLKEACERAKKDLSQQTQTDINLPFITADASGPKHLQMTVTRAKFEQLTERLFERCRGPVLKALKDAGLKPTDIDEVVLVGGMTRVPRIQQMVKEIFGKEPHKGVNPDEVVAVGAAIQGAQLLLGSKSDVVLLDVTPLSLGIETLGGELTEAEERTEDRVCYARPSAEYFLRTLWRSEQPHKVLLLSVAPPGPLGGEFGNRVCGDFIDSYHPSLCVVAGTTERRGSQWIAHTLVVNPGRLADGSAAWLDWNRAKGEQVEFLRL
jgi:hypothetical protein